MPPLKLDVQRLRQEAFAPFGDVIAAGGCAALPINAGSADRYHALAAVDVSEGGGRAIISLVHARPPALPLRVRVMERHPLGSQAFIPLNGSRFLIIAAAPGAVPGAKALRAFLSDGSQGVNYRRGVWHHPLIALDRESDFLVVDRDGPGDNCEEMRIDHADVIVGLD